MKVTRNTIDRADRLILEGEQVLSTYSQPGNIDAHDMWITAVESFLKVVAPQFLEALREPERRYRNAPLGDGFDRAVYKLIQEQLEVLKLARDSLEQTDDQTSFTIAGLYDSCKAAQLNPVYAEDLLASLSELKSCYDSDCHIAVMSF